MAWWEVFGIFKRTFEKDPLTSIDKNKTVGVGVTIPDSLRSNLGNSYNNGEIQAGIIRGDSEFIDYELSGDRKNRYNEFRSLLDVPEVDTAVTVFANESCLDGDTRIPTPNGEKTIRELSKLDPSEKYLVYAYDFVKMDYTLAWAHSARKVKKEKTVQIIFDNGERIICTPDHLLLMKDSSWREAGALKVNDTLMPFYKIPPNNNLNKLKNKQFPRIYTHRFGWIHERQFVDEWTNKSVSPQLQKANECCRLLAMGMSTREIKKETNIEQSYVKGVIEKEGFTNAEMKWLGLKKDYRKIIAVLPYKIADVYDLTVEEHHNFATTSCIVHNCQKDEEGRVFQITCKNKKVKEELEFLFFHRKMLNFNQTKMYEMTKRLLVNGDEFIEVVIDPEHPEYGVLKTVSLPAETMYRIETNRGRLVEFQQSFIGPDYSFWSTTGDKSIDQNHEQNKSSSVIRFSPNQIIHFKVGEEKKGYSPYGLSILDTARAPAILLKLMEDAMMIYRLTRSPERRVFYIDTHGLSPSKSEFMIERMKDNFRKKKVPSRSGLKGASGAEERYYNVPVDDDIWIPMRPNSNTRIDVLPGAQNLGEIDDTLYFRNKLLTALKFPKAYIDNEDINITKQNASSLDPNFARYIERNQSFIEDGLWTLADIHLTLLGVPEEEYEDLMIRITPPSDYREIQRQEVVLARLNAAAAIKNLQIISDLDIMKEYLKYDDEDAQNKLARMKIQKIEETKLQIIMQNPQLAFGLPGDNENEVGTEANGPDGSLDPSMSPPMPSMDGNIPSSVEGIPPTEGMPPESQGTTMPPQAMGMKKYMDKGDEHSDSTQNSNMLPMPSENDIKKYDLDIYNFEKEMDYEEPESF